MEKSDGGFKSEGQSFADNRNSYYKIRKVAQGRSGYVSRMFNSDISDIGNCRIYIYRNINVNIYLRDN